MLEAGFQSKIIKAIEKDGGFAVNGKYTKNGIPDLLCGIPMFNKFLFLAVEVKTDKDYERIMSGISLIKNRYIILEDKKLKPHEFLQIETINRIRDLGGLAIIAYSYEQVKEYINENCI